MSQVTAKIRWRRAWAPKKRAAEHAFCVQPWIENVLRLVAVDVVARLAWRALLDRRIAQIAARGDDRLLHHLHVSSTGA